MADVDYAGGVAAEFVDGLARAGTTTALVFGAHFAPAVDLLFERAAAVGLRITAGLVVERPEAAARARDHAGAGLRRRARASPSAGTARNGCATPSPRASRSPTTPALLESVRGPARRRRRGPLHLARQREPGRDRGGGDAVPRPRRTTSTPTTASALLGRRSVLAHNVHPTDAELDVLAAARTRASRTARRATARWAAACSRCAATSSAGCGWRWAPTSARAPASPCSGRVCRPTSCRRCSAGGLPAHVRAHALAGDTGRGGRVGPADDVGDLSVGRQFDAVWVRPQEGSTLDRVLGHADDADDALAKVFALAGAADIRGSWVAGGPVRLLS